MKAFSLSVALGLAFLSVATPADAQSFPPGTFSIDGIPVQCGPVWVHLNPNLPDVGMSNQQGIILNPIVLGSLPTPLKLYWFGHECGHFNVGMNETSADCWAIRTGRTQGWFRPRDFDMLHAMLANNPGDMAHPSGPQRVRDMALCYQRP